tara:strand:- start:178 stop:378 length:201 start_codon:yes stop_codon:yes gene_type:complete
VKSFVQLLTAALNAYIESVRFKRDRRIDELEDELARLAADGSPSSKLLLERMARRIRRERKRLRSL